MADEEHYPETQDPQTQDPLPDETADRTAAPNTGLSQESDIQLLPAGTKLEHFRVEKLLGHGGMACVYLAENEKIGREVALKILRPEQAASRSAVRRFFAETRAANRIKHPAIIQITDFFEQAERPFFVMEYLEGSTVSQLLRRDGPPPIDRALHLAAQVGGALAAAHNEGVVHRDLKPGNVFVREEAGHVDEVKLLDFGIAKIMDDTKSGETKTGSFLGTPSYMAPEQLSGRTATPSSDIYCFGLFLYELVAGRPPFDAPSFGDTVVQHMIGKPEPLRHSVPAETKLPRGLEHLVLQMLAKEPADRPLSMGEVNDRLAAIRDGKALPVDDVEPATDLDEPTLAPAPAAPGRSWLMPAALGGLLVAGLAFAFTRPDPPPPEPSPAPAPAPEKPPPAPTEGKITLQSDPTGARVVELGPDGATKELGVTPLELTVALQDEPLHVRFEHEGHDSVTADVPREDGQTFRAALRAIADPGSATPRPPRKPPPSEGKKPVAQATPPKAPPKKPGGDSNVDLGGVIDPFGNP
jgi:serine/threonine-protein kinase